MTAKEKAQIYHNVWSCAYQRRSLYKGTEREYREHDTVSMCLKIAKWWKFEGEK